MKMKNRETKSVLKNKMDLEINCNDRERDIWFT